MTGAHGIGLATIAADGTVLDTWFPAPELGEPPVTGTERLVRRRGGRRWPRWLGPDPRRGVEVVAVRTGIAKLSEPPARRARRLPAAAPAVAPPGPAARAEPRRHLRHARQRRVDQPRAVPGRGLRADPAAAARAAAPVTVYGVDKFPRMVDYVVPSGVRIADADRVRLGAHLAPAPPSCTRASSTSTPARSAPPWSRAASRAGVVVGDGSDIGGGASIMGTLSGGGKEVISIGERCLLGANAGIGISLGDDCVVEAGLYVTAGTQVTLPDGRVVKARELSGASGPAVPPQLDHRRGRGAARATAWASRSTPPCTPTTDDRRRPVR